MSTRRLAPRSLLLLVVLLGGCSSGATESPSAVEVTREVPVTVIATREVEVTREVPVTVVITKEVEVTREVAATVQITEEVEVPSEPAAPEAATIPETEMIVLHSAVTDKDYRIYVALPRGYSAEAAHQM